MKELSVFNIQSANYQRFSHLISAVYLRFSQLCVYISADYLLFIKLILAVCLSFSQIFQSLFQKKNRNSVW